MSGFWKGLMDFLCRVGLHAWDDDGSDLAGRNVYLCRRCPARLAEGPWWKH